MDLNILQIILLIVAAAIIGMGSVLDEFQTHRPLVACTMIGAILGDVQTGVILGGSLELIALGWINVGAAQSPDTALASVISTILVVLGGQSVEAGIAIAIPIAAAGQVLTVFARTITIPFQHAADRYALQANFRMIDILHISALAVQALRVAIPTLVIIIFLDAEAVRSMFNAIPDTITGGLEVAGGIVVIVGFAMVLNMMRAKALMPFFFLGFVLAVFTDINLLAFGIIGVVIAMIYIQLNPVFQMPNKEEVSTNNGAYGEYDDFDD